MSADQDLPKVALDYRPGHKPWAECTYRMGEVELFEHAANPGFMLIELARQARVKVAELLLPALAQHLVELHEHGYLELRYIQPVVNTRTEEVVNP